MILTAAQLERVSIQDWMQTVLRIFHLKADKMRPLYQQLRNKYQMHCAYAQGNAKMREAYNKWRDPRRRQWSNTR